MNLGYVKFMRSEETVELLRKPKELSLLAQISLRARRKTSFSAAESRPGEALIGFQVLRAHRAGVPDSKKESGKVGIHNDQINEQGNDSKAREFMGFRHQHPRR